MGKAIEVVYNNNNRLLIREIPCLKSIATSLKLGSREQKFQQITNNRD
jgi:hypothetical protein